MKKFFSLFSLLFMLFALNASADVKIYLKSTNVQAGAKGKIDLCLETENPIGTVNVEFTLPEGVKVVGNPVSEGAYVTFNPAINNLLLGKGDPYYSTGVVATINVEVDADAEIGEHPMTITMAKIVEPNLTTYDFSDVESTLAIQKSAVIDALPEGFDVAVSPFVAKDGDITLNFNYKSSNDIKNLSFDVELPEGIFFMDDLEWDRENVEATFTAECNGTPAFSNTLGAGDHPTTTKFSVSGTYSAKTKKYIKASEDFSSLATITASVMTPENEYVDVWEEAIMQEGLSTIKLSNIVIEDVDGNTYTGESLASVIYGQPSTQEAILYGNYDEATANAFTTALKNVAIADVTAATVDDGVKFTDVLVNENGGHSYYTRTSANYGTTVLPLDLMTDNADKLYRIVSMDSEGIVIEEIDCVAANTPCIFKGTINVEGATPTLGVPSEQGLGQTTFKGTYEATKIDAGAGYYISSNGKFYNDGASVRPFRGYFEGNVSGVKSLSVLIDTPDGLKDITDQFSKEDIYNLQGMRMNNVQKGINIKGGKKVLVK